MPTHTTRATPSDRATRPPCTGRGGRAALASTQLAACFAVATLAAAAAPTAALADTHRVLAVGNSYTFYNQPTHAAGVYEELVRSGVDAWDAVVGEMVSAGGYTLADHAADLQSETPLQEALVTGTGEAFDWDVVILQDQSLVPGLGPLDGLYAASLAGLATLDAQVAARGAATVLMQTWGRRAGHPPLDWVYPDFETMNDLLIVGYDAYQTEISTPDRTAVVAPVGQAFARVFEDLQAGGVDPVTTGTLFWNLYTGDGSHPSALGSYLAGCVLFATVTGHDPTGLWAPAAVAPADAEALAKVARRVVLDEPFEPLALPFGERPRYPWVTDWASWIAANPAQAGVLVLSHPTTRPAVGLAEATAPLARLEVGADHAGSPGAARLVLRDHSASLDVGELVVGGGGLGGVEQRGGVVDAEVLILGEAAGGRGRYTLSAGALRIGALEHGLGSGSFAMSGGTLRADAIAAGLLQGGGALQIAHDGLTAIDGVYLQQAGATLKIGVVGASGGSTSSSELSGGRLEATEDATLHGTLQLEIGAVPEGQHTLDAVIAASIHASDLTVDAPEPFLTEVTTLADGRQALRITLNPGEPTPGSGPDTDVISNPDAATSDAGSGGPGADTGPLPGDDAGTSGDAASGRGEGQAGDTSGSEGGDASAGPAADTPHGDESGGAGAAGPSSSTPSSGSSTGGCRSGGAPAHGAALALLLAAFAWVTRRPRRGRPGCPPTAARQP